MTIPYHLYLLTQADGCSGGLPAGGSGGRIKYMNTQPLEMVTNVQQTETTIQTDTDILLENGFSHDEIISLLWLQQ